jgi:hypothetical protein
MDTVTNVTVGCEPTPEQSYRCNEGLATRKVKGSTTRSFPTPVTEALGNS